MTKETVELKEVVFSLITSIIGLPLTFYRLYLDIFTLRQMQWAVIELSTIMVISLTLIVFCSILLLMGTVINFKKTKSRKTSWNLTMSKRQAPIMSLLVLTRYFKIL